MRSLFWKKIEPKKGALMPRLEEGLTITYMIDTNKYIHFGGFTNNVNPTSNPKDSQELKKNPNEKDNKTLSSTTILNKSAGLKLNNSIKPLGTNLASLSNTALLSGTLSSGSAMGGTGSLLGSSNKQNNECQQIFLFDPGKTFLRLAHENLVHIIASNQWSFERTKGRYPIKRIFHQSWYEAPYMFIYGGMTQEKKILFDIYALNCDNYTWKRFFSLEGPMARLHCAFANMGLKKYFIGGASFPENLVLSDVWSLSFENVVWDSTSLDLPGVVWEKIEFKREYNEQEGVQMPNLKSHSAIKVSDSLIFIYGGYDQKGECTETSLLLDVENFKISYFDTKGKKPGPRAFHKMIPAKENIICLFGGVSCNEDMMKSNNPWLLNDFYILNLNEGYWSNPVVGGYSPSPRCYFGIAGNQSELYGQIIVLGGKTGEKTEDLNIYMLSEISIQFLPSSLKSFFDSLCIDPNENEAWGIVNEREREKEIEILKKVLPNAGNTKRDPINMQVSKITLEISEADRILNEQKRQIGDLEGIIKTVKSKNNDLEQKRAKLKDELDMLKKKTEDECDELNNAIQEKQKRNEENKELNENLKTLLGLEIKKRKLLNRKTIGLQNTMRKAENGIICIDSFYNKCVKDNLLPGIVKEDILNKTDLLKSKHKEALQDFKQNYEIMHEKEKKYKIDLKSKKEKLAAYFKVSDLYKQLINKGEELFIKSGVNKNELQINKIVFWF